MQEVDHLEGSIPGPCSLDLGRVASSKLHRSKKPHEEVGASPGVRSPICPCPREAPQYA